MINFLSRVYYYISNFKALLIINIETKKKVTLIGTGHQFGTSGRVYLHQGSTKNDIVMDSHSEMWGEIYSFNHGKVTIGSWSKLGRNSIINCVNNVSIGKECAIADHVIITDHNYHPINPRDRQYMAHTPHGSYERSPACSINKPVIIGDNVWIGNYARICKGVSIGNNSIIGANTVVTKDIPANCIAVGNPARIVRYNIDKETQPIFPLEA